MATGSAEAFARRRSDRAPRSDAVVAELHLPGASVLDVAEAWTSTGDSPRIVILGEANAAERCRADGMGAAIVRAPRAVQLIRAWGVAAAEARDIA